MTTSHLLKPLERTAFQLKQNARAVTRLALVRILSLVIVICWIAPALPAAAQESTQKNDEFEKQLLELSQDEARDEKTGKCALQLTAYKPALEVAEQHQGPDRGWAAACLYKLGEYYSRERNFPMAEYFLQRAVNVLGKDPELAPKAHAGALHELALVFDNLGDFSRAEPLYEQALKIGEPAYGPDSPFVLLVLNNLGNVHLAKADYQLAAKLFEHALVIARKNYQPEDPFIAVLLGNVAYTSESLGDIAKAEQLLKEAIAATDKPKNVASAAVQQMLEVDASKTGSQEKAATGESVKLAVFLNNLGALYLAHDAVKAPPLLERALAMREKLLGPNHPDVAYTVTNLAMLDWQQHNFKRAEERFLRALAITQKAFEPGHVRVSTAIEGLAWFLIDRGEKKRAIELLTEGMNNNERNLPLMLATGSEKQKRIYMESISEGTSGMVSIHLKVAPDDPQAARLALTTLLRRKGRVLDVMSGQVTSLMKQSDASGQELIKKLQAAQSQLSSLEVNTTSEDAQSRARIEAARSEVQALEKRVSERATALGVDLSPVSIEAVQAAIPANAALIEMVKYRPARVTSQAVQWEEPQYAAYILKHTGAPSAVELGDAAKIEQDVDLLRRALGNKNSVADVSLAQYGVLARKVDETVMRPIRKLLGNTNQILISPDGAFNFVPFAALKDEQNRYLAQNYTFSYLTSGRDLLRLRERLPNTQGPVVIANPLFNLNAKPGAPPPSAVPSTDSRSVNFGIFQPLDATSEEAQVVSEVLPNSRVFTGAQATESVLKQVKGPSILHIATHGFFHSEPQKTVSSKTTGVRVVAPSGMGERLTENVLSRSGLALAGANQKNDGQGNDGIFTALEASVLDLHGTRLVVLSACETGRGEVQSGEGVYGLRRALVLAGAESQMISLWKVNDEATRDLMIDFYGNLQKGMGRAEALRQVQINMLKHNERKHPYFWAAFILSGQWAPL